MGLLSSLKKEGIDGETALRWIRRGGRGVSTYGGITSSDAEDGLSIGQTPSPIVTQLVGLARIVEAGPDDEANFTDARYWVEWLMPYTGAGGIRDAARMVAIPWRDPAIEAVTNIQEVAANPAAAAGAVLGCHLLDTGRKVWVYVTTDDAGNDRYVIDVSPSPVHVRITNATGCGKGHYNGNKIHRPVADINKANDLTTTLVGAVGPTVIIRNLQEIARASATPWLTNANNTSQKDFVGTLAYVNSDGTPVIDIGGLWGRACSTVL